MTTALHPYPKPTLRDVTHLTPDATIDGPDPWAMDMHGTAEDKAPYTCTPQPATPFVRLDFDLNKAVARAHLTGIEGDTLRIIMAECWEITPAPHYAARQLAGGYLADETGHDLDSTRRALTMLKARNIVTVVRKNCPQLGNAGDIITVNTDPATWLSAEEVRRAKEAKKADAPHASNLPYSAKMTNTDSAKMTHAGSSNLTKNLRSPEESREINKSISNSARAHEGDVSLTPADEQAEDQAIVAALAASVQPEPIRTRPVRPLPKRAQAHRASVSPGDSPEIAFVAWREGFIARFKHDPPRMTHELKALLRDLTGEYPAVVERVVRGYFVWTKLDEGEIRAKGLAEVLEKECAACAGDPTRTPFPPKAPSRFGSGSSRAGPVSLMTKFAAGHATKEDMTASGRALQEKFGSKRTFVQEVQP